MTKNKWIKLSDEDSARIKCSGDSSECKNQATYVQHSHWNSGNTEGTSFWYFCDFHTDLVKMTGKSYEPKVA